jgi:hypothetical protein
MCQGIFRSRVDDAESRKERRIVDLCF